MPLTQPISISHHPTIISTTSISPVHSQYPSPSTPPPRIKGEKTRHLPSPRRPPPLDLKKIKEQYPATPAQNSRTSEKEKTVYDPFDVAEVEPGHRYTEWKGGSAGIKPGQVIPRGLLGVPKETSSIRKSEATQSPDQYESVLHNVLLTPTYLRASPLPVFTPSPSPWTPNNQPKRRTLMDKAVDRMYSIAKISKNSGWTGKGILKHRDEEVCRSVRTIREREEREMDRFRRGVRPIRLAAETMTVGSSYSPNPMRETGQAYIRCSPSGAEWNVGSVRAASGSDVVKGEKGWRETQKEEDALKRRQKIAKVG